ncbi:hypothetical protein GF314_12295 [bacterium]|nr:hypothetical protein [bacterium]
MEELARSDYWGQIRAGLRPSSVLLAGAILMFVGPLLQLLWPSAAEPWYFWGLGLLGTGVGLMMCGPRMWASTMVLIGGLVFIAQGVALAAALLKVEYAPVIYRAFALPKSLILIAMAITERKNHGRPRIIALMVAGGLSALKLLWRVIGDADAGGNVADLVMAMIIAAALILLARGLRHREDEWAARRYVDMHADFSDFDRSDDDMLER